MNDANARQQIVDSIKTNNNVLVTVSTNPSVDELSAALGLTILIDNLGKRGTAVVSGKIPPAINFLDPAKTFEGTADSLRDFIIALDKEKADHLRYKVEGDVVKIFITPYRTQLSQKDLDFSLGDYNVELVIALGVQDQDHLDKALDAHGAILHDATVVTVMASGQTSNLGSINWQDAEASSLCEMMVNISDSLKGEKPLLDEQIATAFLTGIVSATDRFSNNRTTSGSMTMAAQLMAAGANQQLIAAKLEEAHEIGPNAPVNKKQHSDGSMSLAEGDKPAKLKDEPPKPQDSLFIPINHPEEEAKEPVQQEPQPTPEPVQAETTEQALARELAEVAPPPVSPAEATATLGDELAAAQTEEVQANQPAGAPSKIDFASLLPGNEPPAPPTFTAPVESVQPQPGNGYLSGEPASTQAAQQSADPFAKPLITPALPPLPTFPADPTFQPQRDPQVAHSITPAHSPEEIQYEESPIPNDPAAVAAVPDFTAMNPTGLSNAAPPPLAPVSSDVAPMGPSLDNLPPLPPLPDLSTPPPPPDFGSDTGQPLPPPPFSAPPAGGQFTLPGQQ